MNTTAKSLIQALIAGAVLAAAGWMLAKPATPAADMQVVQLERVVITGKRMQEQQVAQLPRVVITGKRLPADADTVMAQAPRTAVAKI